MLALLLLASFTNGFEADVLLPSNSSAIEHRLASLRRRSEVYYHPKKAQLEIPYESGVSEGRGWRVDDRSWASHAFEPFTGAIHKKKGTISASYDQEIIKSTETFQSLMQATASVSASGWGMSAKVSASMDRGVSMTSKDVIFVVHGTNEIGVEGWEFADIPRFKPAARAALCNQGTFTPKNFAQRYGDYFVIGVRKATALDLFFKMTTTTSNTESKVSSELQASFNGWGVKGGGSATFTQALKKEKSRENFVIISKAYGTRRGWIPNISPANMDKLDAFIEEYEAQVEGSGIAFKMQRYSDLDEYHSIQAGCGTTLASFQVNEYFEDRLVEVAVEAKLLASETDERYDITSEQCTLEIMGEFYKIVEEVLKTPKEQINAQRYNTYKAKLSDLKKRWDSEAGKCSTGPQIAGFISVGVGHCSNSWAHAEHTSVKDCAANCKADPWCTYISWREDKCHWYTGSSCAPTPSTRISYWKIPDRLNGYCNPNTEANRIGGFKQFSGHTLLSCHEYCLNDASCAASTYWNGVCIAYKQCGSVTVDGGWKTLHKNYAACAKFGCTCQGISDHYGTTYGGGWGSVPSDAGAWWKANGCTTQPRTICAKFGCTCQGMSTYYGTTHNVGWGSAPAALQTWWMRKGCTTKASTATGHCNPNSEANRIGGYKEFSGYTAYSCYKRCLDDVSCHASSYWNGICIAYKQCGSTTKYGDWLTVHKDSTVCNVFGCTCQGMSTYYGTTHNVGWGSAPSEAQTWWMNNGCTTKAYTATGYCSPNDAANRISAFNSGYTAYSCHNRCMEEASCVASSHWSTSCVTYRKCTTVEGDEAWKTVHKNAAACAARLLDGKNLRGNRSSEDVGHYNGVSDVQACSALCTGNASCEYFVYEKSGKNARRCWLKKNYTDTQTNSNVVSGFRCDRRRRLETTLGEEMKGNSEDDVKELAARAPILKSTEAYNTAS